MMMSSKLKRVIIVLDLLLVAAKAGHEKFYELGVIIHQTPFGASYGHSGFFPGYPTEMRSFPDAKIVIVGGGQVFGQNSYFVLRLRE